MKFRVPTLDFLQNLPGRAASGRRATHYNGREINKR
jgi:hypothetical protein